MLTAPAQARAMDYQSVNLTVVGCGVLAIVAGLLFRRWLWLILLPPGMAVSVYVLLNVIGHHWTH
jgi:hypothetical protein